MIGGFEHMITKENFIKYIGELEKINKAEEELGDVLSKFSRENRFFTLGCIDIAIKILQDIFKDHENDWIGYAVYELDWFKEYREGTITYMGDNVPLANAGDLYDLLIENLE